MVERLVTIKAGGGLHARPAAQFVALSRQYASQIRLTNIHTNQWADGKTILMVIALRLGRGATVRLTADGPDEKQALTDLSRFLESDFDSE